MIDSRTITLLVLVSTVFLMPGVTGCVDAGRFDTGMRARCFDSLWSRLQRDYVYFEIHERLHELRNEHRAKVLRAPTRRAYLVELAKLLARLDDPHVQFRNLDDYWRTHSAAGVSSVHHFVHASGGRFWVSLKPQAISRDQSNNVAPCPGLWYELRAVDGVPAGVLAIGLLRGPPGEVIKVTVLDAAGSEQTFALRCPSLVDEVHAGRGDEDEKPTVVSGRRLPGDIGYIELNGVRDEAVVPAFDSVLDEFLDTRALVLDLRQNTGGRADIAAAILGRFISGAKPCAEFRQRSRGRVLASEIPIWYSHAWRVRQRGVVYHKPIVVLIDTLTVSGGELLALALHDVRGAVLVGHATMGGGAGLSRVRLPDGLTVSYSVYPIRRLDGRTIQYVGVQPDIAIPFNRRAMLEEGDIELARWRQQTLDVAQRTAMDLADQFGTSD